jgi:type II secretory pathway pseudopilin PulG
MIYRAFTLIETIVVTAMTTLVIVTLGVLLTYFYRTNAYALQEATQVAQARQGIDDAMLHLREASYGSDGSYPIASAATSSVVFYANINNNSYIEQVTYSLQNGVLYRTVAEPSGNPPSYAGATVATSTIATYVVNGPSTPVFLYFDDTGTQLMPPVNVAQIASVQTTVVIDVDVNRAPVAITLSGAATLRNLRSQL